MVSSTNRYLSLYAVSSSLLSIPTSSVQITSLAFHSCTPSDRVFPLIWETKFHIHIQQQAVSYLISIFLDAIEKTKYSTKWWQAVPECKLLSTERMTRFCKPPVYQQWCKYKTNECFSVRGFMILIYRALILSSRITSFLKSSVFRIVPYFFKKVNFHLLVAWEFEEIWRITCLLHHTAISRSSR